MVLRIIFIFFIFLKFKKNSYKQKSDDNKK